MRTHASLCVIVLLGVFGTAWAADPPVVSKPAARAPSVEAASRIVAVTVYSSSALVTREVETPAVQGAVELVVGPLPPSTVVSSLYSESADGIRVMSTRYRTRVVQENTQDEVRKLETQLKDLKKQEQDFQKQSQTIETNVALLAKLEGFTAGSLKELTEKGMLKAEEITALVKFIMDTRSTSATQSTLFAQKLAALAEQQQYLQREMSKVSTGSDKTIREAVIVIDGDKAAAGKVKFNYLVSTANWRPQYKLRASKDKPEVTIEYIAAITQQSGEDWTGVDLVLSTAQPMLNANPPELASLEVNVAMAKQAQIIVNGGTLNLKDAGANYFQANQLRLEGQNLLNTNNTIDANRRYNDAAAYVQSDEIMNPDAPMTSQAKFRPQPPAAREGQSVTFHLERKLSVPWRDDEQIIEVARATFKPEYFYKAVPVLTPHVYRLATLTNDSKLVILPGEATMYVGTDFVGRATLPLVAVGEQFTAGFGVDPQLQISRQLVDKSRTVQGGNQVLKFDYRLAVTSYKSEAVKLQLWDRLPHGETEAVNVTLIKSSSEMSTDADYVRDEKPKNLLRWDLTVEPNVKGEKAPTINYQYKMEYAKEAAIGNFLSK